MASPSYGVSEDRILAALGRIERKLDELDRELKSVKQDVHRVKIEARNKA
jgi:hypothetical protein